MMCPCSECVIAMKEKTINNKSTVSECDKCYNFWINPQKMYNNPDSDYPIIGPQQCIKLTYKILEEAVTLTHQKIVDGTWTDSVAKSYLNRYCLNNHSKNDIIENANNIKKFNNALFNEEDDVVEAHKFLMEENPDKYRIWSIPSMWRGVFELEDTTEPIMHQFFLGVVKNLLLDLLEWASLRRMGTAMKQHLLSKTKLVNQLRL